MGGPTIHLCHPFTARAVGWPDEAALPEFHSGPHAQALRHLDSATGSTSVVSYFTDEDRRQELVVDGLRYRFWPRSRRVSGRHDDYRKEWSHSELLQEATHPSDVTIINLSGHGGRFSHVHAKLLRLRRRPYAAMIGGAFATTTGQQGRFLEHAAVVAVHSHTLRNHLVDAGLPIERVMVVPLGVDTTHRFNPGPSASAVGSPVLLFVGRIVQWKGVHVLIEAFADIAAAVPEVSLRLVGPCPDANYADSLQELSMHLGVSDRVTFVGALPRQDLVEEYRQGSLMVLPSQDEGFGMVVAESMACGTAVVGIAGSPGPEDMITSGQTGLLVKPERLAQEIVALLRDPARLADLSHAARSSAVDHLSTSVTAERFEQLVDTALRPTPQTANDTSRSCN